MANPEALQCLPRLGDEDIVCQPVDDEVHREAFPHSEPQSASDDRGWAKMENPDVRLENHDPSAENLPSNEQDEKILEVDANAELSTKNKKSTDKATPLRNVRRNDPYQSVFQDAVHQQHASFITQPRAKHCQKPKTSSEAQIRRDRNDAWRSTPLNALFEYPCAYHNYLASDDYCAVFVLVNVSYRFLVVDESHKAVLYGYKDAEAKPFMMCDLCRRDGIPSTIPWFDPCKKMGSEKYTILAMVDTIMCCRFEGRCDDNDLLRVADCLDGNPQVQGRTTKILVGRENGLETMRAELWERIIESGVFGGVDVVKLTGGLPSL